MLPAFPCMSPQGMLLWLVSYQRRHAPAHWASAPNFIAAPPLVPLPLQSIWQVCENAHISDTGFAELSGGGCNVWDLAINVISPAALDVSRLTCTCQTSYRVTHQLSSQKCNTRLIWHSSNTLGTRKNWQSAYHVR